MDGSGEAQYDGATEQLYVQQLPDGTFVTADGQQLVLSKEDVTALSGDQAEYIYTDGDEMIPTSSGQYVQGTDGSYTIVTTGPGGDVYSGQQNGQMEYSETADDMPVLSPQQSDILVMSDSMKKNLNSGGGIMVREVGGRSDVIERTVVMDAEEDVSDEEEEAQDERRTTRSRPAAEQPDTPSRRGRPPRVAVIGDNESPASPGRMTRIRTVKDESVQEMKKGRPLRNSPGGPKSPPPPSPQDDANEEVDDSTPRRGRPRKNDIKDESARKATSDNGNGPLSPTPMTPQKRGRGQEEEAEEELVETPQKRGRVAQDQESERMQEIHIDFGTENIDLQHHSADDVNLDDVPLKHLEPEDEYYVIGTPQPSTSGVGAPRLKPAKSPGDTGIIPEGLEDIYNIDQIDEQPKKKQMCTPKATQTIEFPPEPEPFVEVELIYESPGRRSVLTQTDPRLKKKKFGPLNRDLDDDDDDNQEYDEDDEFFSMRKVKRQGEDSFELFEDVMNRKRSIKRNTEEALKCPFCEKAFIGLVKHIKSKHTEEPEYEEEMRNARWRERIMKVSSISNNAEGDGGTCEECGKVAKNMKRHLESHQQNRLQIPCPICGKIVLKSGMSSHLRTVHSGRRPYKCPHCEYTSAFRGNLNTHIKGMHLHTRQYLCSTCHAAFKTLGALIGHTKRVHEGWKSPNQKIFICSVCEKRFTKKYHVDRHMLIHTGEKPHKCTDCGRTFNNKSNLMSHIQLVHKKLSPYQCDLCKETFKRKKLLLEHIGKIHVARGEHIVFRSGVEEYEEGVEGEMMEEGEYEEEEMEGSIDQKPHIMEDGSYATVEQYDTTGMYGESGQVTMVTEDGTPIPEGQITTLQTASGEETIIIVHATDVGDVTQAVVEQPNASEHIIYN